MLKKINNGAKKIAKVKKYLECKNEKDLVAVIIDDSIDKVCENVPKSKTMNNIVDGIKIVKSILK